MKEALNLVCMTGFLFLGTLLICVYMYGEFDTPRLGIAGVLMFMMSLTWLHDGKIVKLQRELAGLRGQS
jgi:hypothetical protein